MGRDIAALHDLLFNLIDRIEDLERIMDHESGWRWRRDRAKNWDTTDLRELLEEKGGE